jgi:hypothetical protein
VLAPQRFTAEFRDRGLVVPETRARRAEKALEMLR